jgi:hypothetical protein
MVKRRILRILCLSSTTGPTASTYGTCERLDSLAEVDTVWI